MASASGNWPGLKPLDRSLLVCLSTPLDAGDQDASNRSLQPTRQTNTFEPFELPSAPLGFAFALPYRADPPAASWHFVLTRLAARPLCRSFEGARFRSQKASKEPGDARPPLLAILPRVRPRLTAWSQLRPHVHHRRIEHLRASLFREAPSPRRFQPRAKLVKRSSDAPCRLSVHPRR